MATLIVVGLSHHSAPLGVRERVAFDEARWAEVAPASVPTLLISTCNRVEVYGWCAGRPATALRSLERALARGAGMSAAELHPYLNRSSGREALLHLVRVAAGLDSLVVGEDQIRGQLREALKRAAPATPLRSVFQRATESARRVRGATQLNRVPSIAAAGVHLAQHLAPGGLSGQSAVVLGAGVMARAATQQLLVAGARVQVLNRTPAHAATLVAGLGRRVRVGSLDDMPAALRDAAIVVSATAARTPVLSAAQVGGILTDRSRPLLLLDIAVPRNIDPAVRDLPGVRLFDMDDLERECPVDLGTRQAEIERAERLASEEADRLAHWVRLRSLSPAIAELRSYAEDIRVRELRRSSARLRNLTPEQAAAVEALTAGIVNKLLHGPTVALRDTASSPAAMRHSRTRILRVLRPTEGRTA